MMGLVQGEKYKKNTIKKLARLLEEAYKSTEREGEIDKISARIGHDLERVQKEKNLDKPLIDPTYVPMVLEDKYKQKRFDNTKSGGTNIRSSSKQVTTTTSSSSSQEPQQPQQTPGPIQSTEEPKPVPQSLKEARDFDDWVNNLYDLTRKLAEQITGYNEDQILKLDDNFKLISETRQYRFDVAKRLAELESAYGSQGGKKRYTFVK